MIPALAAAHMSAPAANFLGRAAVVLIVAGLVVALLRLLGVGK